MKTKYAVLAVPLFLSGCMMAGMGGMGGGMHGASQGSSMSGQTLIKESVVNGIRITAEFPPYTMGDALAYTVTLRDVRDKSTISDASLALIVTPADMNQSSLSAPTVPRARHADSAAPQSQGKAEGMKVSPEKVGDGTYVFRPSIMTDGAYQFVFLVERVGNATMNPPIEVEHTVQLNAPMAEHAGNGDHGMGSGKAPLAIVGVGVMAAMMLFMFR